MPTTNAFRCVLMGDQSLLTRCGDLLIERGHAVAASVTGSRTVADWAEARGIPVFAAPEAGEGFGALEAALAETAYDWFFSIANLRIVPPGLRERARRGAINFHDGPLPLYAGLNAPAWAILSGETRFGVTWHAMTDTVDAGPIHVQRLFDLSADETAFTLNSRCFEVGLESFRDLLDAIEADRLESIPQRAEDNLLGRHHRPSAAGLLRFDRPAEDLERLVRGLDFGPGYANPLFTPKLRMAHTTYRVGTLTATEALSVSPPGTVLAVAADSITVASLDRAVRIEGFFDLEGAVLSPIGLFEAGQRLPLLDESEADALSRLVAGLVRHEDAIRRRLVSVNPLALAETRDGTGAMPAPADLPLTPPATLSSDRLVAALAGYLVRVSPDATFDVAYADAAVGAGPQAYPGLFAPALPMRIAVDETTTADDLERSVAAEIALLRRWGTHLSDLPARRPELPARRFGVGLVQAEAPSAAHALPGCAVTFVVGTRRPELLLVHDLARLSGPDAEALAGRVRILLHAFAQTPHVPLRDLPLMSITEQQRMLAAWTGPTDPFDRTACVHTLVEAQVDLTPEATALVFGEESVTYRALDARANRVAALLREKGVGPDRPVGLYVRRGIDLVVGALAIQKAGSAYLPLDPTYPSERLAFMIEDSGVAVVLTQRALAGSVPGTNRALVAIEDAAGRSTERVPSGGGPEDAAYVIYTSGSTGRPKGVVIEHRNVANFFAGMDERVAGREDRDPVWLAVTSLSFDIAVLELFWTLARGFEVVIAAPRATAAEVRPGLGGMAFSLFHWGNDDAVGRDKYRLLIEGARFADSHGFCAVWTPERHFHAFGGPYPNPAVTGAAVAAVTRNVGIRAGSCVLPLHHPARVAEEWAVIDNLSDGRVALAFASGWMPEDFVLRPENAPPHNKAALLRDIETVRRLWRGETVPFGVSDKTVAVATLPRPVQAELPVWVTTAGNPDTFREAAALGANVLTHLLGQTIEELAEKIAAYRAALVEAGRDPAAHTVTLMLHTLLGENRDEVRSLARKPMRDYLRSAAGLIKQYAWAFPAFRRPVGMSNPMALDLSALDAEEMEAILDYAFERYFEDSGLFGTVEDALARAAALKAVGVDEIACLIDFGIPNAVALERLHPLAEVVARAAAAPAAVEASLGAEIRRHGVTHLQCTPSMMRMLLADVEERAALGAVDHLYLGGEALPGTLLAEMAAAGIETVENMYGPTETTIWSSTQPALPCDGVVPLGRPIVNTRFYVLDAQGRIVPPGLPGELHIGGAGVARGYLGRPELDAARFLTDPFLPGERLYRTGDRVRSDGDGTLHYLGRVDDQVKLRGHRIELGEIEAVLHAVPGIREAVVAVREDQPGDARLVAYLRLSGGPVPAETLRAHLARSLPEVMIPALFVPLDRFPLTANAKVDRNALPAPASAAPAEDTALPDGDLEQRIAAVFGRVLGLERIGRSENFFGLGGHSLLAVQAHRDLKAEVAPDLAVTDLFRFPSVAGLARHLADRSITDAALGQVADRAAQRRSAMRLRAGPAPLARDAG
ncbi:MupA/Atu3671 family FMN-dependent luciferase-like monooxygenase [Methylorubrum salsuginis]|uniref:Natural product biosynthesis luciferase-like monooxygenase domain-containing protein n=1 Tax=Methylorubrum salsuginis TaxID=414703 RepID=A0A1I4LQP2_9HYPH|nr:MupA/Atu3671 family FMN-dependent luciferase-like monooxygenase [Methylorubrum salsuginis]SFL93324.1 natural product biosynthesis luciferase-like monooxygenase domain-containing protein [Methylorubrum salsuginis]